MAFTYMIFIISRTSFHPYIHNRAGGGFKSIGIFQVQQINGSAHANAWMNEGEKMLARKRADRYLGSKEGGSLSNGGSPIVVQTNQNIQGKENPSLLLEETDGGGIGDACVSRSREGKTVAMAGHRSSTVPLSVSWVFVVVVVLSAAIVAEATGRAQSKKTSPSPQALAICQRTDYPPLCVTYAIPARWRRVTVAAMTRRSILSAIEKTQEADATAKKLLATAPQGKDGMRKANLNWCDQAYRDALGNLVTSVKNLKGKDKEQLNINLSTALSDYTACNDVFAETPGGWSPLQSTNALLNKLVSNSLALAEMDK